MACRPKFNFIFNRLLEKNMKRERYNEHAYNDEGPDDDIDEYDLDDLDEDWSNDNIEHPNYVKYNDLLKKSEFEHLLTLFSNNVNAPHILEHVIYGNETEYGFDFNIIFHSLCENPNACYILGPNIDKINLKTCLLWKNPDAIQIIERIIENDKSLLKNICPALSINPNAIHLIEKYWEDCKDYINMWGLSRNPNAISLLEKHFEKIDWNGLVLNPNAIELIEKNLDKLSNNDWSYLNKNPNAVHILEKNQDRIHLTHLCQNKSKDAIKLIEKYSDNLSKLGHIDWCILSSNPFAVNILEKRPDKISWSALCENSNGIELIEKKINSLIKIYNEDTISYHLSKNDNPRVIKYFENGLEMEDAILTNINAIHLIAPLDHKYMFEKNKNFKRELVSKVFEPDRLIRMSELFNMDMSVYVCLF